MRMPNGYGSVYKLSGKRRRPFVARITTSITDEGVQKFETLGYFEKRPDALEALAKYYKAPISKPNMTLAQTYDEWSDIKFKDIIKSSENVIRAAWNYLNVLSTIKMRELRTAMLQKVINDCPRARDTKEDIKSLASQLFKYAMQNDIVNKNYADFITLPKAEVEEKEPFSTIELVKIEKAAADGIPFADCILILCYMGWRIGEFLTLTRFSYNEQEQVLTGGSKTEAGKSRAIPIHPKIQKYVKQWINKNGDTLFCKDNGKPYTTKYFREECYIPALKVIKVRELNPHSCRHTFATMLNSSGASPEEIKRLMGHTKYLTTARYTHADLDLLKKAIKTL